MARSRVDVIYRSLIKRLPNWVKIPVLQTHESAGDDGRHYGRYYPDDNLIVVAPDLEDAPDDLIRGVLAHELGHAIAAWLPEATRKLTYDENERYADSLAEDALGLLIYYDPDDLVQRTGAQVRGIRPRPKGLR